MLNIVGGLITWKGKYYSSISSSISVYTMESSAVALNYGVPVSADQN